MSGATQLVCRILYGGGLRLVECLSLRVKDIDFERNELTIRDGKGAKDRVSVLPSSCRPDLEEHLQRVRRLHEEDLARRQGRASLPFALALKYRNVDREWAWQYVFPASSHYTDPHTGLQHRHHLHETVVQKAVTEARRKSGLTKPATPHTLPLVRHAPARLWLRHPDRPGAPGPLRRPDDHDLHPRPQSRRSGRPVPCGRTLRAVVPTPDARVRRPEQIR
jgi:integrase